MKKLLSLMLSIFIASLSFAQTFPDPGKDFVVRGAFFSTTKTINSQEYNQNWNSDSTNVMTKDTENLYSFQMFLPAFQDDGLTPFTYYYTTVFKKEGTVGPRNTGNRKFTLSRDAIVNFYAKAFYNSSTSSYQTQFLCDAQKVSFMFMSATGFTGFTKELPLPVNGKTSAIITLPLISSKIEYIVLSESSVTSYPYVWQDLNNTTYQKQTFITANRGGRYKIMVDYPTVTASSAKVLDTIISPKIKITDGTFVSIDTFAGKNLGTFNNSTPLKIGGSLIAQSKYQSVNVTDVVAELYYRITKTGYDSGIKEVALSTMGDLINYGSSFINDNDTDISTGLENGNYNLQVWYQTSCLEDTLKMDNNGNGYSATFVVNGDATAIVNELPADPFLDSTSQFGVNLACGEFGKNPGTFGTDYTYPKVSELDYYKSKGLTFIRMPFKWERVQHDVDGPLDTDGDLQKIKDFVQAAKDRGIDVVLDMHNYARRKVVDKSFLIGKTDTLTVAHFVDVWTKLAAEFKDYNIGGYDIMNEPHDMGTVSLYKMSQAVIDGIRSVDDKTPIYIEGNSWASAYNWKTASDSLKYLVDPSNNLIYQAHCYFDSNASGVYAGSYDTEVSTDMLYEIRLMPFFNWLKENNKKGMIGEFGVPANDSRWLTMLDRALTYMKENNVSGTYWAGGPWWGTYKLSIEPTGTVGSYVDKPQMAILQKYGSNESGNTTEIENIKLPIEVDLNIKCLNNCLEIKSSSKLKRVEIYNLLGMLVYKDVNPDLENQISVNNFTTGNYIVRVVTMDNCIVNRKIMIQK